MDTVIPGKKVVHKTSVDTIKKREHWYTGQVWIQNYRGNTGTQDKCGYRNTEGTLVHRTSVDTRIQREHWHTRQVWKHEYRRNTGTQDKCG